MNRFVSFFVLLFASAIAFGQTEVPHTFQSGQPARASEVNENFDALEAGVDANSAAIAAGDAALAAAVAPLVFDGNDNEIGQLISIGENLWTFLTINQFGYIQNISFRDGTSSNGVLVYESTDCSGTPYSIDTFGGHVQTIYDAVGTPSLYYVDKSAVPVTSFSTGSLIFDGECFVQGGTGSTVWPVSINDPAITGVSTGTYALPIRIERVN